MNKKLSLLFILMLLFQTITSSLVLPTQTKAEGSEQSIFNGITVTDEEGNILNQDKPAESTVNVHVDWSVLDADMKEGSTEKFTIPTELYFEQEQTGILVVDEIEVGTFQASVNGTVAVIFNKEIEEHVDANGTFILEAVVANTSQEEKVEAESPEAEEIEAELPETNEKKVEAELPKEKEETDDESVEEDKGTEEKPESEAGENEEEPSEANSDLNKADDKGVDSEGDQGQVTVEEKHGFILELAQVTDLDGNLFTEENLLDPAAEFKLKLDWNLEDGHNYVAGDKERFDLPKGIKIIQETTGELQDASGAVVATYKITTDKKVELTFTDFVENYSNVIGYLEIISKLDEKNVEIEDGEAIIDPIGDEGQLKIPVDHEEKGKTIEKNGKPNKGYNADEINWEVIINRHKTSLTDAKVTDLLPKGTEYKEDSLKVTKLKVDIYGNILGDEEEVEITGETVVDDKLTIPLGDIKDAYRIEYVTTVTDDEKTKFTNDATLSDAELDDIEAQSTITINRGEAIKKKAAKGYDPKTGIIEWEIEFNYNEKDLTDVTLKDAWTPEGKIELVEDSLKFIEVEIDENGVADPTGNVGLPEGATLVPGTDQFEVTEITTNKSYKVTYQTKVKDRVLDGFEVANTAGFGTESDGSGTGVGAYYGSKSAGTINYKDKTVDWKIELNHDEFPMEQISITDTLGEGLTLKEDTLKITVDGEEYTGDHTLSGDNPFTIEFPDDFTTDKKIIITYKTNYVADQVPDQIPTNKAAITWTPDGENESITKDIEARTELNNNTKKNDWKNGSYDPATKEITWTIYTNYRENDIKDLIVTDAPQGNQKIVKDSIVVTELTIDENGNITEGDTVDSSAASIDEDANTLQVTIGETNKAYKIEYRTSLAGLSDIQKEYLNKAEVLDGSDSLSKLEAKVGIVKSDTYGEKSGYQDGKQVHWSVKVNLGQQMIENLKLEDTISDNQDYLVDTFKVYKATVDRNGNATKGEEVPADQYELMHTPGEQVFTVAWINEVERAFIVEYSTLFFEEHGKDVTNNYKVTGDSITDEDANADGEGRVTIEQLSSGGGSGEAGYLVIDKVGKKDGVEAPLAGAEFDLIDSDTGKVLKSGVTDENGQIDFGRLLFGKYELHERVVPDGYVTKNETQTIEIDKKYESGDDKEAFAYTIENYEPVFAIELSKTDNENNALSGAEFTLFDSDNLEVAKATTGENGKILFEDLERAGTYYVQETKAPAGYVLDSAKHEVIIGEKEPEPVTVSVENTPRGAVLLMKIDTDTNEPLAGVEFDLQKLNDQGEYETIDSFITDDNGNIQTSNTLEAGSYQFVETKALDGYRSNEVPKQFEVDVNDANTQTFSVENEKFKGAVKLIKTDAATDALLADAEFKLVDTKGNVVRENLVTNEQGEIAIDDLLLGAYQLIETKAPAGYELDETPIDVEITEDLQVVEKTMTNNKITDISVEKKWNNAGGDTTPVTVKLLPTDKAVELNEENDWKAVFKDLHVYDESGEEINYQVEEVAVAGYKATNTGDKETGFMITNTELTSVSGTKTWLDDNSDERPESILVQLFANGAPFDEVEVTEDTDWTYEFTDLVKYDEAGKEIAYTVDEVEVDNYETTIDGFDIMNLRVGKTSVEGTKTWLDNDSKDRPKSITVHLLANGEETGKAVEVTADTDWKYAFTNLEKYDNQGKVIAYTVDEKAVDGYEKSIKGNDITNLRVGKTEVELTKLWKDENETDRPETITVNLLQNADFYGEYEVTKENDWKRTIADLPKYDEAGKAYEYTVTEHDVPGYATDIDGFEITNSRADVKTIEITKSWLDNDSEDRPNSIDVDLFRSITDGEKELVDTFTVTADADWSLEVKDLPAFDKDGKAYKYEIKEKAVEDYKTSVNGFDITNTRIGKTEVAGKKTWKDDDSKDRLEKIKVNLLQNGEEFDTVEVTAETDWKYSFTNLDKYDENGVAYEYTVEEELVEGYKTTIDGFDITNVRIGTTSVEGTKSWKDDNSKDRPDSIVVELLQNGNKIQKVKVTASDDWAFSFTNLPEFDEDGVAYIYTIEEQEVAGYISTVEGFDLTNTLIPVTPPESEVPVGTTPDSKDELNDDLEEVSGTTDTGSKLPSTATNMFNLLALGVGLLIIGFAILLAYRRKEKA